MQSKQSKQCLFRGLSKKIVGGNVFLASVALCSDDIEIAWEESVCVVAASIVKFQIKYHAWLSSEKI
jgi:hypothetical protein